MTPLTTVHSEYLLTEFRAPRFSTANLWCLLKWPLLTFITLLLAFMTQGLWRRTNTYLEQPTIELHEKMIFVFENKNTGKTYFWAQLLNGDGISANFNNNIALLPMVESNHWDYNGDLRADEITIRVEFCSSMPAPTTTTMMAENDTFSSSSSTTNATEGQTFSFTSIFYAIFFDVRLERRAWVQTKAAPIFGQIHATSAFNELSVFGDLEFVQLVPLPSYGELIIDDWNAALDRSQQRMGNNSIDNYDDDGMMRELLLELEQFDLEQNFSISLGRKLEIWRNNKRRPSSSSFPSTSSDTSVLPSNRQCLFNFTFQSKIREQILHYRTDGWELLKWAWIQYLAMFIIVRAIFNAFSSFLYQNQILNTIVVTPTRANANTKME